MQDPTAETAVQATPDQVQLDETFAPAKVTVVTPDPGEPPIVRLQLLLARIGPSAYLLGRTAIFEPRVAVEIGEELARAGRSALTGLTLPTTPEHGGVILNP